jgi:hypothetical protein
MDAMEWTTCPECGGLAEVRWRDVLASTSGPVDLARILCVRRHTFLMPLPAEPPLLAG